MARQPGREGGGAGVDAIGCEGGQVGRGAGAGQHGAETSPPRAPAAVAAHVGQVAVPCGPRLGPGREAGRRGAETGLALAPGGPSPPEVIGGAAGALEAPTGVALRPPRAVGAVGLAAGSVLGLTGLHAGDLNAPRCQDWDPGAAGHSGAFPHARLEAAGLEPIGPSLEGGRPAGQAAYRRWPTLWGQGHLGLSAAHVEPRGLAVQRRPAGGRLSGVWRCRGVFAGLGPRRPVAGPRVRGKRAVRPGGGSG